MYYRELMEIQLCKFDVCRTVHRNIFL